MEIHQRNTVVFEVTELHNGILMRDFLRQVKGISHKGLCRLKNKGKILCNGAEVTVRKVLESGDKVILIYPPEMVSKYLVPESMPLNIVFEDRDLILLDKAPGICIHPTKGYPTGTIANGLIYYYQKKGETTGFHAVNRLDKDTSGLVVIAKNTFSKQQLFSQQQQQTFRRTYQALVHGQISPGTYTIQAPIKKIAGNTTKREIHQAGQLAITHYEVIKTLSKFTLIKLQLITGRTHQIRLHLSSIGHPLAGDILYGGSTELIARQALHADTVTFFHPRDKREMFFSSPLPADLEKCIRSFN